MPRVTTKAIAALSGLLLTFAWVTDARADHGERYGYRGGPPPHAAAHHRHGHRGTHPRHHRGHARHVVVRPPPHLYGPPRHHHHRGCGHRVVVPHGGYYGGYAYGPSARVGVRIDGFYFGWSSGY